MTIGRMLASGALAAALAVGASAPDAQGRGRARAPEAVRQAVIAKLQSVRSEFMEPGDPRRRRAPDPDPMLTRLDVDGDGRDDWRADYERAEWAAGWCGTGGCLQQLWVGAPGGRWVLAMDTNSGPIRTRVVDGEHRLEVSVHGSRCGGAGADDCRHGYAWDRRLQRLVERPNFTGGTRIVEGGAALIDETAPRPVARAALTLRCAREDDGGEPQTVSIPDVNGDGRRDWAVWSGYACPAGSERVIVMASTARGGFVQAYSGRDESFEVDVATAPARFVAVPACADRRNPCPRRPLRWSAANRTLQPVAAR